MDIGKNGRFLAIMFIQKIANSYLCRHCIGWNYIMNIYLKWFLIVSLNSVSGFIWGTQGSDFTYLMGMISGVLTWYVVYLSLDVYLQKNEKTHLSRQLFLSALLRIPLQFLLIPDMIAGIGALHIIDYFGIASFSFFASYAATLLTGLFLSGFCVIIFLLINAVNQLRYKRATS
jgi:hypothetical protein